MSIKNKHQKLYPIYKKGRFYNKFENHSNGTISEIIYRTNSIFHEVLLFLKALKMGKKRYPENPQDWYTPTKFTNLSSINPQIHWIGHSSFLIQIGGINILTDPVFGNITFLYPRFFPPGISLYDLPKIDYILISHNHIDHMEEESLMFLKRLYPNARILVPFGDKQWFDKRGFQFVYESFWWDKFSFEINTNNQFSEQIQFSFLPAFHWSQRSFFDQNRSLWGSWMIEYAGFTIYFSGDTAYSDHFSEIAKEFPSIDIAFMPIAPCEPKWCSAHISAEESGRAFLELNAKHFIPMHWGTFTNFGTEPFETPIKRTIDWWENHADKLEAKQLHILKIGEARKFELPQINILKDQILTNQKIQTL